MLKALKLYNRKSEKYYNISTINLKNLFTSKEAFLGV